MWGYASFPPRFRNAGPLPMIEVKQGKKHEKDKIVFINGHQITYRELAEICIVFCKNEDNIYPPPFYRGGQYFIDFITECMNDRCVSEEILKKYKLTDGDKE